MKVLFFGTPAFAVDSLRSILNSKHTVVGVVTQPDRALKHGNTEFSPVKKAALDTGLSVFQPLKVKTEVEAVKAYGADIGVTAAYGQILNADVINAFPNGIINVHASLLPKYRGASPIQAAIRDGEKTTGVTIMKTELGIDTGDMLLKRSLNIGDDETCGALTARLAALGGELVVQALDEFDSIVPTKQDDSLATHCKMITKEQQYIDFSADAHSVVDQIRSLSPVPCAKTLINGEIYKIFAARVSENRASAQSGAILDSTEKLTIACGNGAVDVLEIQAPSKRVLGIADFLRGKKFELGVICAKP